MAKYLFKGKLLLRRAKFVNLVSANFNKTTSVITDSIFCHNQYAQYCRDLTCRAQYFPYDKYYDKVKNFSNPKFLDLAFILNKF